MERRDFLKAGCKICLLGATGLTLATLEACSPTKSAVYKADIKNSQVSIPLSLFATSAVQFVRPKGWYFDIAVTKEADDTYSALLLKCTHMDNQLNKTSNGYSCSLHGSQFDKLGKVTNGPAERPLKRYRTIVGQDNLTINI